MYERVIEIIVYIVNELRSERIWEDSDKLKLISQKLADDGYTESEINYAFSWIFSSNRAIPSGKEFSGPTPFLFNCSITISMG